jgi:hypothetical protein
MALGEIGMGAIHSRLRAFGQRVHQRRALPDRLFHRRTERAQQALAFDHFGAMRQRFDFDVTAAGQTHAHARATEGGGELGHERDGGFSEGFVRIERGQQIEDARRVCRRELDGAVDGFAQSRNRGPHGDGISRHRRGRRCHRQRSELRASRRGCVGCVRVTSLGA